MSYTSNTLQTIITRSFDGRKSNLAKAAGLAPRVITMITGDQRITPSALATIARILSTDEARELCLAAARDFLPPEYSDEFTIASNTSKNHLEENQIAFIQPDPRTRTILTRLSALVAKDREARDWLHKTARWIFPDLEPPD